ncbi:MAG: glycosyltransferase, partial [Chloroflexota bacterium]|nr:glycosyltransferase [Chloroflexota bacterium]
MQNAGAVTTNSSELASKAKAFFDREFIVIHNGIDAKHFKPFVKNETLAESLGLKILDSDSLLSNVGEQAPRLQNNLVVGFVGELREKKGLQTLLNAYAQNNTQLRAALLIIGEVRAGEDKKVFEEFVQANPTAKIVVTGYISATDLPVYYSLIDVFVHPSLR